MAAEWKWVVGYEGLYKVSDTGEILNVSGKLNGGKLVKASVGGSGYPMVHLRKNGVAKTFAVHRLVADAFLPNPEHLAEIDHINGNKEDNRLENLERVSSKENKRRAKKLGLWKPTWLGKAAPSRKAVIMDGKISLPSITEAAKSIGASVSQVSSVVNGHRPHTHGHTFQFAEEVVDGKA